MLYHSTVVNKLFNRFSTMNRARYLFSGPKPMLFRVWLCQSTVWQSKNFTNFTKIAENSLPTCEKSSNAVNNSFKSHFGGEQIRKFSSTEATATVSQLDYEHFCTETLDCLTDYVEELVESTSQLETADVLNKVRRSNCLHPILVNIFQLFLIETSTELFFSWFSPQDGVLTISLGSTYGTYVINKQTPNKQIWLSSPTSGPKRFDFVYAANDNKNGYWIYRHTGTTLHELLDTEFSAILNVKTTFHELPFGSKC